MAPGDFNGKDYGGGHTGMGWYHYNWSAVPGYSKSYPKNDDLIEGTKVTFIGNDKRLKHQSGVILKKTKKMSRSFFPVHFENKNIIRNCTKNQLQLRIILNDPTDIRNVKLKLKKEKRLRVKKKQKR